MKLTAISLVLALTTFGSGALAAEPHAEHEARIKAHEEALKTGKADPAKVADIKLRAALIRPFWARAVAARPMTCRG